MTHGLYGVARAVICQLQVRDDRLFMLLGRTPRGERWGRRRRPGAWRSSTRPLLRSRVVRGCGLEGPDDRGATLGLHRDQPGQAVADPAQLLHLAQRLVDADQPHPAAGRIQDEVRDLPVELLGDLVPHGLLALETVRLGEGGDLLVAGSRADSTVADQGWAGRAVQAHRLTQRVGMRVYCWDAVKSDRRRVSDVESAGFRRLMCLGLAPSAIQSVVHGLQATLHVNLVG